MTGSNQPHFTRPCSAGSMIPDMLLTVLIRRERSQLMRVTASKWHVGQGEGAIVSVTVDPHGPMDARSALCLGLRALLDELERPGPLDCLAGGPADAERH